MAEIKPVNSPTVDFTALVGGVTTSTAPGTAAPELPPPKMEEVAAYLTQHPELAAPLLSAGLALEVLMEALGSEERKTAVKTSTETLKAKAAERKEINDKQLGEIKERLEKMRSQSVLNGFLKAFKIIGAIFGAIAAAATIVAGALTANPLLIAGGAVTAVLAVDSLVGAASDGKYGIAQGVAAGLKAMGVDEKTAQWIGFGFTMALAITGAALSLGGAAASAPATAISALEKATKVVSVATQILSAANTIAGGGVGIAAAVNQYDIEKSRVTSKELEAILARLQEATEVEQEFLKTVMKKFEDLLAKVGELVQANNETQAAILGGGDLGAPMSMA